MIIELTGIPGSGKSTILKKLEHELKDNIYIFDIKKYILGFSANTFVFDIVLLLNFFRLKNSDWNSLKKIFEIVKASGNSFFHKINILRNSYKKFVIYRMINKRNKIFFIDEGVSHIPFTVFVDISKDINSNEIKKFLNMIPSTDKILMIDAPEDMLLQRVIKRGSTGHRRINFSQKEDIVRFMQQSREVLEIIKKHYDVYVYINDNKDIDIKKIINLIGLK
jgi:dephospho-CoA kinase